MIRFNAGDTLYWSQVGDCLHLANTRKPPILVHVAPDDEPNRAALREVVTKLDLTAQAVDFTRLELEPGGGRVVALAEGSL